MSLIDGGAEFRQLRHLQTSTDPHSNLNTFYAQCIVKKGHVYNKKMVNISDEALEMCKISSFSGA